MTTFLALAAAAVAAYAARRALRHIGRRTEGWQ